MHRNHEHRPELSQALQCAAQDHPFGAFDIDLNHIRDQSIDLAKSIQFQGGYYRRHRLL